LLLSLSLSLSLGFENAKERRQGKVVTKFLSLYETSGASF